MTTTDLTRQAETVEQALRVFCVPGQVVELRALGVQGKKAVCETFNDLSAMASRAVELDAAEAQGCYFTLNPLKPELAGWKDSRIKAPDVIARHWLPIDVDPYRPVGASSTEDELRAAWDALNRCRDVLDRIGMQEPRIGFSGNGWHLLYPVALPNDDGAQEMLKSILKGLQERCGDTITKEEAASLKAGQFLPTPKARIDTSTHDAPRIWKLYGTTARKGPNTPERPHRRAFLLESES